MKIVKLLCCLTIVGWAPLTIAMGIPKTIEEAIALADARSATLKRGLYVGAYQSYVRAGAQAAKNYLNDEMNRARPILKKLSDNFTQYPNPITALEHREEEVSLQRVKELHDAFEHDPSQAVSNIQQKLGARANIIEEDNCPTQEPSIKVPTEVKYLVPFWEKYLFNGADERPLAEMQQILADAVNSKIKHYNWLLSLSLTHDERGGELIDFTKRARKEGQEEAHKMLPYFTTLNVTLQHDPSLAISNIRDTLGPVARQIQDANDQEIFRAKREVALAIRDSLDSKEKLKTELAKINKMYPIDYMGVYGSKRSADPERRQGIFAGIYLHELDQNPQNTINALKMLAEYKKQVPC